ERHQERSDRVDIGCDKRRNCTDLSEPASDCAPIRRFAYNFSGRAHIEAQQARRSHNGCKYHHHPDQRLRNGGASKWIKHCMLQRGEVLQEDDTSCNQQSAKSNITPDGKLVGFHRVSQLADVARSARGAIAFHWLSRKPCNSAPETKSSVPPIFCMKSRRSPSL